MCYYNIGACRHTFHPYSKMLCQCVSHDCNV
nr:MAG TPA: hypothetical protein [Caudoviricetes sp.]